MALKHTDIPHLTPTPTYKVDVSWTYLEPWLDEWMADGGVELEPDFQRAHVWDDERRAKYVEYVLRGGCSSTSIYWNKQGWKQWGDSNRCPLVLVDGLQRLTAVRKFMRDGLAVFPVERYPWSRPEGYLCSEIERSAPGTFKFHMYVNGLPDRQSVLQWYIDLNDGGVAHTPEEIRRVRQLLDRCS